MDTCTATRFSFYCPLSDRLWPLFGRNNRGWAWLLRSGALAIFQADTGDACIGRAVTNLGMLTIVVDTF